MSNSPSTSPNNNSEFESLLEYLRRTRGFDFKAYKRTSLMRRIDKRMQTLGIERYTDYMDYLEVHPDEFSHLFNTILINVTDFFRDDAAWKAIGEDIIPRILASKKAGEPIRVWSAGAAAGQEAYTIAMILSEAMGEEAFKQRAKIYATDVDEEALNEARLASYGESQVQSVPSHLKNKYFEQINGRYVFKKEPRRAVIFGRHDLLQDSPISRVDLLICRNTVMYFNAEAQARILSRFDFALNGGGFLFLGKAEVMLIRNSAFAPVDMKHRIFAKLPKGPVGERLTVAQPDKTEDATLDEKTAEYRLRDLALELDPVAQILLNPDGQLVYVNAAARALFGLKSSDLRQRLQIMQLAYLPRELRQAIEQAIGARRVISSKEVEWTLLDGERRFLDVLVAPLLGRDAVFAGIKITFIDVSHYRKLEEDLVQSHQELETANEQLQSSNEELETTNEELQSTVEELETTNEELQSTNEELETMNEELQSTNEELDTANEELRQRGDELNSLNAFLESIMASMRQGVIVLNRNLQIHAWNARAEDLWGLRADEVRGQHFFNLDIGLPVEKLNPIIRACLAGENKGKEGMLVLEAINRRGKSIWVEVTCTAQMGADNTVQGVILTMEEVKRDEPERRKGDSP